MDAGGTSVGVRRAAIGAGAALRRRAVVAVGDHALRASIRSLLVRVGVQVASVGTAEGALEACVGPVEVVILDLGLEAGMPAERQGGLCRRISELPGMRHVPVIALVAQAETVAEVGGFVEGARACLSAPFDASSLLRAMAPVLSLDAHGQIELIRMIDQDRGLTMP